MFFGPLLRFVQFFYGFLNVVHGIDSMAAPFAPSVLQVVVRPLESIPSGIHLGWYIALQRLGKQSACGYENRCSKYQSCDFHLSLREWHAAN